MKIKKILRALIFNNQNKYPSVGETIKERYKSLSGSLRVYETKHISQS